jgi:hypothetical protein
VPIASSAGRSFCGSVDIPKRLKIERRQFLRLGKESLFTTVQMSYGDKCEYYRFHIN